MSPQSSLCLGQYICQQLLDESGRWRWVRGGSGAVGVRLGAGGGLGATTGQAGPFCAAPGTGYTRVAWSLTSWYTMEAWSLTMAVSHSTSQQNYQQLDRCTAQNRAGAASEGSDMGPALPLASTAPARGTEDFVLTSACVTLQLANQVSNGFPFLNCPPSSFPPGRFL